MISPEKLRRYPFFGALNFDQIKEIAMISETVYIEKGEKIFDEGGQADSLYLIEEGLVDLYFHSASDGLSQPKELNAGEVSPGEFFGFSSLVEPFILSATARASQVTRAIKIDSAALRVLCEKDSNLGYRVMTQLVKVTIERLNAVRVQLAAAYS